MKDSFFSFFDPGNDFCFVLDRELNIIEVNEKFEQVANNPAAKNLSEIFSGEAFIPLIEDAFNTSHGQFEAILPSEGGKNESILWKTYFDKTSGLLYVAGIVRQHVEDTVDAGIISSHFLKFRKLFEKSNVLLSIADFDANVLEVNSQWTEVIGYTIDELKSINFLELIHPEDREETIKEAQKLIDEAQNTINFVNRYRTKNGEYKFLEWNATRDEHGQFIYSVARDITEQQKHKDLLKFSENKLKRISKLSTDYAYDIDLFSSGKRKFRWEFGDLKSIVGYSSKEILGYLKSWNVIGPGDLKLCNELIGKLLRGQQVNEKFTIEVGDSTIELAGAELIEWIHQQDLFHPDDLLILNDRIGKLLAGERVETTFRLKNKSGDYVWLEELAIPCIKDNDSGDMEVFGYIKEVTPLKKHIQELEFTRKKLEENVSLFEETSELASIGYWEVNLESMNVYWNRMTRKIHEVDEDFNCTVEEAISFYFGEENQTKIRNLFDLCVNNGVSFDDEFQIKTAKGTIKWVRAYGLPKYENAQIIKAYGLLQDITDKKLREIENKRLSLVANKVHHGVVITDEQKNVEWVNEAFTEQTGYSFKEVKGQNLGPILQGEDTAEEDIVRIRTLLMNQKPFTHKILNYHKDKSPYWNELSITPIFSKNDTLTGFIGIQKDITLRVEAERELIESKNRIIDIANSVPGALVSFRRQPGKNDKCLFATDPLEGIFEIPVDSVMKDITIIWAHFSKEDQAGLLQRIEISARELSVYDFTGRIKVRPGENKWVRITGYPKRKKDDSIHWDTIIMDVTESKLNEEQLHKIINEKNNLFKELHHRIKNNLQMVTSMLFLKTMVSRDKELNEFIIETQNRINSIAKIHDRLLQLEELDKLDTKRYFEELIHEVIYSLSYKPDAYTVNMEIYDVKLQVDTVLSLGLIINELISNIVKHAYSIEEGGPINISFIPNGEVYRLTISDMGKGLAENIDRKNSIGLLIVDELVQQIKGTKTLINGNGTAYVIEFSK